MTAEGVIKQLQERIDGRSATIGVCGMGYVGLPLAAATAKSGFTVIGFDIDESKVQLLNSGTSYIDAVSNDEI